MGGFNPQSVGMNRVRAHRRMTANLQPMQLERNGKTTRDAGLHALQADAPEDRLAPRAWAPLLSPLLSRARSS